MPVGTCGVFAVNSHCDAEAFVREVLLYDLLLIPTPPEDEPTEWDRWVRNGWDPSRQRELLAILGTVEQPSASGARLAYPVEWDEDWRGTWRQHWAHTQVGGSPFAATAQVLRVAVPAAYDALEAIVPYQSFDEFVAKVALHPRPKGQARVPGATLVALVGRELLLPNSTNNDEALRAAVDLACEPEFHEQRRGFDEWTRRFLRPLQDEADMGATYTDPASIKEALDEIRERVTEYRRFVRRRKWKRVEYVMAAATFATGAFLALPDPLATSSVFASVGQYVAGNLASGQRVGSGTLAGAAMVVTAEKRLGWTVR